MVARKTAETTPTELESPPVDNIDISVVAQENEAKEVEAAIKKAPARKRTDKPKGTPLNELNESHLIQPSDGSPYPIYVRTANLQATVVSDLGRPLLKLSPVGWVGDEAVVLPVADAGELREIADLLDAEAAKR